MVPAYLAAVPDFFSLTRTVWPGDVTLKIRDNISKHLKEGTSSKMGDASSMSESEDAEMTSAVQGDPPVGKNPGGQSSGTGQRGEGPAAAPKAPPKALVTKEMMTSVNEPSKAPCSARWRGREMPKESRLVFQSLSKGHQISGEPRRAEDLKEPGFKPVLRGTASLVGFGRGYSIPPN